MQLYQKAIAGLRALDLSQCTEQDILALIAKIKTIGFIRLDLPPGMSIMRGRPEEGPFISRSELSYKPQQFNRTYQRASTPNHTMFYGVVFTSEEMANKPLALPRLTVALEASKLIRDDSDGIEPITYSRWIIQKPLPVLVISTLSDRQSVNSNTEQLRMLLREFANSPEVNSSMTLEVTDYLAEVFSKWVHSTDPDYFYKISAVVSEFFLSQAKGAVGGLYYPSVRAYGAGYVVAVLPSFVDSHLKLVAAGGCRIYKSGKKIEVDNECACLIDDDSKPFKMQAVDEKSRRSQEDISKLGFTRWEPDQNAERTSQDVDAS